MLSYFTHSTKGKEPEKQAPLKPVEKEEAEEADKSPVLSPQDERFLEHVVAEEGNDLLTYYDLCMVLSLYAPLLTIMGLQQQLSQQTCKSLRRIQRSHPTPRKIQGREAATGLSFRILAARRYEQDGDGCTSSDLYP